MDKRERRRINPIAHITLLAVLILVVFEILVMCGALELKAQTVAKYAPWAYEPFLRLVGEHPESSPRRASIEETDEKSETTVAGVAGLESSTIPILIGTNESVLASNVIMEATIPQETEAESEPVPGVAPTNAPKSEQQEIVPVG